MGSAVARFMMRCVLRRSGDQPVPMRLEFAVACVLWLYLFTLIVCLVVGRSIGSALFLSRFDGAGLATIYISVGITVALIVGVLDRIGRKRSHARLSAATLMLMYAILMTVGYALPRVQETDATVLHGVFYLLIESFAFITTVQFWAGANATLTTEQAKRLYVFIGTGGVIASIVGGLVTRLLAERPASQTVLAIAGIVPVQLMLVALFDRLAFRLTAYRSKSEEHWNLPDPRELICGMEASATAPLPVRPAGAIMEGPPTLPTLRTQWPSEARRLCRRFGLVAMLMVFSTTLVDFYYKTFADQKYAGDLNGLTEFFGNFYLAVGVTTLVVQIGATPFLLRKGAPFFGLFASPLSLICTTVVSMLHPGILSAAIFKLTDSVLQHSLYRSCHETLFTPLPTGWVRQLKSTCDGFYGRIGLLLAGAFLYLMSPLLETLGPTWLLPGIAVSLFGWSVAIASLRRTYRPRLGIRVRSQSSSLESPQPAIQELAAAA